MIAGRLNKHIVIEHIRSTEINELGEMEKAASENIAVRADVSWGRGRRETANLEVVYAYDITFIVWHYLYDRISEGDIVNYAGKKYMIVSMEPEPDTRMLYIRAVTA